MELWDIYTKDRIKTGKTKKRSDPFLTGEYHLVVHVCIINSQGKMLIQQRQPFKDGWPNMWDITVGGSSIAGENSAQAASRELNEEIGLSVDFTDIRPTLTVNFEYGFDDYYLVEMDVDSTTLQLQYEEVKAVKWASCSDIISMEKEGLFIPYYENLIELLFAMRKRYSSHYKD